MSDFVISQIRTFTPIIVGALISFLATVGLQLDTDTQASLVIALTGVLQALYYFIARLLEKKFPKLGGILLGSSATPTYDKKV